jgi:2-methylcitrate dehydratase PrpD
MTTDIAIKDPAWPLAEHVCGCRLLDLPAATRAATCNDILDTFGCLLGGSGEPGIAELVRVVGSWGGLEQSQVMLWQRRLPAPIAAAIVHGRVGIAEVANIHDAIVLDLAARIDGVAAGQETSGITIRLSDGRGATAKVGLPLGSPENRLSVELTARATRCGRRRMTQCLRRSR